MKTSCRDCKKLNQKRLDAIKELEQIKKHYAIPREILSPLNYVIKLLG